MNSRNENARALAGLSITAEQLNAATDELNQALQTIQQRIVQTNVGVEVWVPIEGTREVEGDPEIPIDVWHEYQVGYGRQDDTWALLTRRLAYDSSDEFGNESWEYSQQKPLLRSPRDLRLLAVRAIPHLVQGIQKAAANTLDLVAEAKAMASGGLDIRTPVDDADDIRLPTVVEDLGTSQYLVVDEDVWPLPEEEGSDPNADELLTLRVMEHSDEGANILQQLRVSRNQLLSAIEYCRESSGRRDGRSGQ